MKQTTAQKLDKESKTVDTHTLITRLNRGYVRLKQEIHNVIIGQDRVIDSVLCCMLAGGHCIVQGVPGLAKTLMVRSISNVLRLTFNRIQFTPDLMPSDITGSDIIQRDPQSKKRKYEFVKGPIFANMVLADEINRTPPKTQAALLQAMQEREVTVSGRTYKLDEPFFVLATQNPIEQEGTYPLPEAALDRFMFMVYIDYPTAKAEHSIVKQTTTGTKSTVQQVLSKEDMVLFQEIVKMAPVSDAVVAYCVRLARATRPGNKFATDVVEKYLKWGAGPRAGQYMTLGSKAKALIEGRITPSFDDVKAVSKLVLRHRVIPNFNAEADGISVEAILNALIEEVPLPKYSQ
ncbi:MAG: AAA domain-containing protein [Phycisphaerae bacterium]|nr:MoxR family ATPase [Phycisphaerae bacterium]NIP54724.1 MoxR family ATPase [Phycisphaerae bacterium]NIS53125.1 MoxR family ATPase [Phycisphaerae bacterium]NIU07739.1 MoxR family ATPase [Phycisphaerae bacterium]NIU55363.1 AAA domain-containing protein [Phycisphaerae bacterium]